jgi:serine/threonine-protein kinase
LAYQTNPTSQLDIWVLNVEREGTPSPFLNTPFNEYTPVFSPDGAWLAYVSDESGQDEVYVTAYPGPGRKIAISTGGGREPLWSPDGRELFYRNEGGDRMFSVPIESKSPFAPGKPRLLFEGRYDTFLGAINYDISPDGRRFLMTREYVPSRLHIVFNWFEELKRLVPGEEETK